MKKRLFASVIAAAMLLSLAGCGNGNGGTSSGTPSAPTPAAERILSLSDGSVMLDGKAVEQGDEGGAVTLSHDIVYYRDGTDATYGEGTQADMHTEDEAASHLVVTIRQPGTYRVSGALSAGQLAVDLGEDAEKDPEAAVTLVLDGVDITCTVAPAVIFYNVYECDTNWIAYDNEEIEEYPSSPTVNTTAAGANVVLADGSENNITGSYVARIYKEGTTKKLHKYDAAFYSKMTMNVGSEPEGTGILNITAENEGLDSELHLTVNGGNLNIQAYNDGINTNEDGVSVTTINGGTLQINAGLGEEGDAIDSNGHLVINGGNVYTMAHERSPDGGIDADGEILLNGGYVVAVGTRNDGVSAQSSQLYMELSFASTLPAGTVVELADPNGQSLLSFTTQKASQAITFSSPDLKTDLAYTLKVNGVVQQYTGNQAGGFGGPMGGGMGGGQFPMGGFRPGNEGEMPEPPEGFDPSQFEGAQRPQRPEGDFDPGQHPEYGVVPELPEGFDPAQFEGRQPPDGFVPSAGNQSPAPSAEGSTEFILTDRIRSFSGISDSAEDSGKAAVTFSVNVDVTADGTVTISDLASSAEVDKSHVQLTVADIPSEDYSASCLWSDGNEAISAILPSDPGSYQLTISITGDDTYTGTSLFRFVIPENEK